MREKDNCAKCGKPMGVEWVSSLYGSNHLLCEDCEYNEECMIEDSGTNDLPELLASYGAPNFRED